MGKIKALVRTVDAASKVWIADVMIDAELTEPAFYGWGKQDNEIIDELRHERDQYSAEFDEALGELFGKTQTTG